MELEAARGSETATRTRKCSRVVRLRYETESPKKQAESDVVQERERGTVEASALALTLTRVSAIRRKLGGHQFLQAYYIALHQSAPLSDPARRSNGILEPASASFATSRLRETRTGLAREADESCKSHGLRLQLSLL